MTLLTDLTEGIGIAVIGYIIVFLTLVFLYYIFTFLPKILMYQKRRKLAKDDKNQKIQDEELIVTGEEATAIAMALYMYRILHDEESDVLTIKRVSKTYTPWSSKIYSMRNYPR